MRASLNQNTLSHEHTISTSAKSNNTNLSVDPILNLHTMKTFMTTIVAAALCMAASSGQVNAYRALQQDISFVSSSSVGSARAMTILGANEDSLLTMTDGRAVVTALTEGGKQFLFGIFQSNSERVSSRQP